MWLRNLLSKLDTRTFYGPHPCIGCAEMIVRAAQDQGGARYDAQTGPVYPNAIWNRHECGCRGRDKRG